LTVYGEGDCRGAEVQVNIIVNPLPKPLLTPGYICIDKNNQILSAYTLNSGLSSTNYSFVWYYNGVIIPGAAGNTYTVDQLNEVGQYSVEVTNNVTSCTSESSNVTVGSSLAAENATYVVSNYFEENQTITISVVGTGTYLYSLDGGTFQESNVFTYVAPGEHTLTIHDANGCTDITIEHIFTIGYPNFFTPNGDGYHDTWNVWSLSNQKNAEIHIFDRFGKLIKMIKPQDEGWDGTFNGQNLPATDYWFTINYMENEQEKIFKAHFTLKR
jgi:gliding motility-associated-like protein